MTPFADTELVHFINARVKELGISRPELVRALGYDLKPNMVSMVTTGRARLPLEHVEALAKALKTDEVALMRMALKQGGSERDAAVLRVLDALMD